MNSGRKRPVALEDLLALKRAERPSPEFWADFDRQLRAKQLAALVGKRPWWREISLAGVFSGLHRYHLPLGAAAVAAITLVSFRFEQAPAKVVAPPAPPSGLAPAAITEAVVVAEVQGRGSYQSIPVVAEAAVAAVPQDNTTEVSTTTASDLTPSGFSRLIPLFGAPTEDVTDFSASTGSRYVDATLVSTAAPDTISYRTLLSSSSRFEGRITPAAKLTVEPLHQITPPSERRGSRILTAMVSMASVESAMRTTERAASRLSEEQLYDQIHRFGARGAGVNVKF